ncbi:MAG: C40 family peptidase [Candidatus Marinimicrobia bacterium]|nr:C40 family peptidase [Candidatus Neomarinimicrobiota bacterium]MDP6789035.1 C40 family peptidase [Candidatus Neomarinimicrobiota bacterium]
MKPSHYTINVSVANLYADPDFNSPVVTQGLMGESCDALEDDGNWIKIRQWDGYESWGHRIFSFTVGENYSASHTVTDIHGIVFQNIAQTIPLRDVTFGSKIHAEPLDEANTYSVILPDGISGFYKGDLMDTKSEPTREQLVLTAKRFLGAPYFWGGKSPKGFDCSGFVQTVFHSAGIDLPRDAHQQYDAFKTAAIDIQNSTIGDVHFFGTEESITHVAMSTGNKSFIHSQGFVKEESLDEHSDSVNIELIEKHVAVCSVEEVLQL